MEICKLVDLNRLPQGLALVPVVLYFPLGIVLATVRLFITIHAFIISLLLPKTWFIRSVILRLMLSVTGIIISTDGDENRDGNSRLLVCDHISPLDHLVTSLVIPHICVVDWCLSPILQLITGARLVSPEKSKEEVTKFVKSLLNESTLPLLFFPEKTTTNGKTGLLTFWSLPFELGLPIQPITIQVKRIYTFDINVTTASSAWWSDLFWCLFVPYTIFKLRYLPITEKKDSEVSDDFKERVRHNMCKSLGLQPTQFSHSDKTDYLKRRVIPPSNPVPENVSARPKTAVATPSPQRVKAPASPSANQIAASPEVKMMVEQVKSVLPHVPVPVILAEIEKSQDIDVTITNILEGNVAFIPEEVAPPNSTDTPVTKETICASQQKFKASSFGNSSGNRHMSLEERKQAMYDMARRKYKEKHSIP